MNARRRLGQTSLCAVTVMLGVFAADFSTADGSPQDDRQRRRRRRTQRPPAPPPPVAATPAPPSGRFRGPTRIAFDDRLIQGQTNQSGAVYLFDRKETGITSMVRRRKSFRHLTIETIYDR